MSVNEKCVFVWVWVWKWSKCKRVNKWKSECENMCDLMNYKLSENCVWEWMWENVSVNEWNKWKVNACLC